MMYAKKDDDLIEASPGLRGSCPQCGDALVAKCGQVNVWHWSHLATKDCDPWSEGETEWHMAWKAKYPKECREIVVGAHRADVILQGKTVLEFQSKALPTFEMLLRERYYRDLGFTYVWIFNLTTSRNNFLLRRKFDEDHWSFRWLHGWRRLDGIGKPFYLDLGEEGMFLVKSLRFEGGRCFGFGKYRQHVS